MQTATNVVQMVIRVTGLAQIVLGLLFWTGNALNLIPVHMWIGFGLVLALLTMAGLAARAGVQPGLVILTVLWSILVPVLGMTQARLLPGDAHWVVQVVHLLVGLIAIGLGERLASAIQERPVAVLPA
jgi:hypothetical protein